MLALKAVQVLLKPFLPQINPSSKDIEAVLNKRIVNLIRKIKICFMQNSVKRDCYPLKINFHEV